MSDKEIAMQITMKALETHAISLDSTARSELMEKVNEFNKKAICEFYKTIFETVTVSQEKS